jgi:hypothetical protein
MMAALVFSFLKRNFFSFANTSSSILHTLRLVACRGGVCVISGSTGIREWGRRGCWDGEEVLGDSHDGVYVTGNRDM